MLLQLIANHTHPQKNPVCVLNDIIPNFLLNVISTGAEYLFFEEVVCVSLDIVSIFLLQPDPLVYTYADMVNFVYWATGKEDFDDASPVSRLRRR